VAGNDIAVGTLALFRKPFEERRCIADLAATFPQRLALLQGHQDREIFLVRQHQVEPAPQNLRPLLGGTRPPIRQCLVRGLDGAARLERSQIRHYAEQRVIGGIENLLDQAGDRVLPMPADEGLLAKQTEVFEWQWRRGPGFSRRHGYPWLHW